jgi:hypothetical protein
MAHKILSFINQASILALRLFAASEPRCIYGVAFVTTIYGRAVYGHPY